MALATSIVILMLCAIIVTGVLQLASHTAQRSGQNRDRGAALNAAQAGIQAELSLISDGSCPTVATAETILPDQNLPTESYVIQPPSPCTPNGPATIVATGYVPNATRPTATTTVVARINRTRGAPVSPGLNGGYDFPDALFTDGALSAGNGLNLYGTGGSIPNITAGTISIGTSGASGSQLGGAVTGQLQYGQSSGGGRGNVSVWAAQIGGPVTGTTVTVSAPSPSVAIQGAVAATGDLTLTNATVNGAVNYGGDYTHSGTTVTGAVSGVAPTLALGRPLGHFDNSNPSDIGSTMTVGAATTVCPSTATAWTSSFYDCTSAPAGYAPGTYSSPATNGNTVIIVQGSFTVDIPQTAVGGQLYVIDVSGTPANDILTINGHGSTLPVFAFTDGALNLSGTLVGQVAAHSITAPSATTLTFAPPATPMADISFPIGYSAPNLGTSYVSTVSFQYQCPGTAAC